MANERVVSSLFVERIPLGPMTGTHHCRTPTGNVLENAWMAQKELLGHHGFLGYLHLAFTRSIQCCRCKRVNIVFKSTVTSKHLAY